MIEFQISNAESVVLTFHYPDKYQEKRTTVCEIFVGEPGTKIKDRYLLGSGIATRSLKDQFNKLVGRKIAMGRALRAVFPNDKETRASIWRVYLENFRY